MKGLPRLDGVLWLCAIILAGMPATQVSAQPPVIPYPAINVKWDVVRIPSEREYHVVVRLENGQPYTPVPTFPGWSLSWTWQQEEFIWTITNANASRNQLDCSNIPAARSWALDFTLIASCDPTPTIRDASASRLPGALPTFLTEPGNNTAQFYLRLGKSEKFFGSRSQVLPANISLGLSGYNCSSVQVTRGRRVPEFKGADSTFLSLEAYDITCSMTPEYINTPPCCVSFSGFFMKGVIGCPSCSCTAGCPGLTALSNTSSTSPGTTAATAPPGSPLCALRSSSGPTPAAGLLVRSLAQAPAGTCPSGCPYTVHVDVPSEDQNGWTVGVAIVNGQSLGVQPWALGMEMPLMLYHQETFIVQYARSEGNIGVWSGKPYFNDLLQPRPGNLVWQVRFSKGSPALGAPAVASVGFGAFPRSVYFMGQKCAMPNITLVQDAASSDAWRTREVSFATAVVVFVSSLLATLN